MKTYTRYLLIPGPVSVPAKFREAYMTDFGSSDLEKDFYQLLSENRGLLKDIKNGKQRYNPVGRSNAGALGRTQKHS